MFLCDCVCFFQAEDGIRDLVRSRGLGDVYKRQGYNDYMDYKIKLVRGDIIKAPTDVIVNSANETLPVSYTHLTLPTSDLV